MLLELGHDRGYLTSSPLGPFRANQRAWSLPWRAPIGTVSPAALGFLDSYPFWNAIFELYRQDKVDGAAALLDDAGIGTHGDYIIPGDIVWLEAFTSEASEITRLNDFLEVELVSADWPDGPEVTLTEAATAYDQVVEICGPLGPLQSMVTILRRPGEIPTAQWHDGYFTPKSDYGKVVVPPRSHAEISLAVQRGLVYQLCFELSAGRADSWLLEASTAILGQPLGQRSSFKDPSRLDEALRKIDDEEADFLELGQARCQAQSIGQSLLAHGGVQKLLACFEEHANIQDRGPVSDTSRALKRTYGFDAIDAVRNN